MSTGSDNENLKSIAELVKTCFHNGVPGTVRATIAQKVLDIRTFPVIQEGCEEVSHVILTATDVGEKAKLQDQALRTARLATLGVLAAGIAHEINNPNSTILFNAPVLEEIWQKITPILLEHAASEKKRALDFGDFSYEQVINRVPVLLSNITKCARRIQRIVAQLKFLVQKHNDVMHDSVDMAAIVHEAVAMLHYKIQATTNRFNLELEANIPKVIGNAQKLEQVVINLILNAIESLSDKNHGVDVILRVNRQTKTLMLTVVDEGCGMDDETMKHIMEPLFTTRVNSGGTGLGLAVSKEFIDQHQGRIYFESEVGKGSRATIELPILDVGEDNG